MSVLPRTPEPEVMDSEAEARDYDAMDHGEVNASFCADLLAVQPRPRRVLDAGTGTALIAIELCRRSPEASVEAIDLASHMLALAARNVQRAGRGGAHTSGQDGRQGHDLARRGVRHRRSRTASCITSRIRARSSPRCGGSSATAASSSCAISRARGTRRTIESLAARYAPAPEGTERALDGEVAAMHARQRALFVASLHAALTVDEVRAMIAPLGDPGRARCA